MRKIYIFLLSAFIFMCLPAISQLKLLSEGFEQGPSYIGKIPDNWVLEDGTNKWGIEYGSNLASPGVHGEGQGRMRFRLSANINNPGEKVRLITPPVNMQEFGHDEPDKGPVLILHYAIVANSTGQTDSLHVYWRGYASQPWQELKGYGAATSGYISDTLNVGASANLQIAFEGIDRSGRGVYLDNIYLTKRPTCQAPSNISFRNITHESAIINWDGVSADNTLKISKTPLTDPNQTPAGTIVQVISTVTTDSIKGLEPLQTYYYYLQTDCGLDDRSLWVSGTFTTACPPVEELNTSFESDQGGIDCWVVGGYGSNENYPVILPVVSGSVRVQPPSGNAESRSVIARTRSNALMMNAYYHKNFWTRVWAISPRIADNVVFSESQLDFWARTNNSGLKLQVMVSESSDDFTEAVLAGVVSFKNTNVYEKVTITFDELEPKYRYVAFLVDGSEQHINYGTPLDAPVVFIDDLVLGPREECSETELTSIFVTPIADDEDDSAVHLEWNPGLAASWHVKVSPVAINPATDEGITFDNVVTSPNAKVENLVAGTFYFYYVQPICQDGIKGIWSNEQSFITDCSAEGITLPYIENFDRYDISAGQEVLPACWSGKVVAGSQGSGSYGISNGGTPPYSAPNNLMMINNNASIMIISPKINAKLNEVQLRFKMSGSTVQIPLQVGVMTDPFDDSTFRAVASAIVTETSSTSGANQNHWQSHKVQLTTYEGNGQYIAFRLASNGTIRIDDLVIEEASGCEMPENLTVTEVSEQSITVDWEPQDNEDAWELACIPTGHTLQESDFKETADSHPYEIGGLQEGVTYDIYVRAACKELGQKSPSTLPVTAKTISPADPADYSCGFEGEESKFWIYANKNQKNKWIAGSAVKHTGDSSVYISDTYGVTSSSTRETTYTYLHRTFNFTEEGLYDFEFWYLNPDGKRLAVFLVPNEYPIEGGQHYGLYASDDRNRATPDGWILLTPSLFLSTASNWTKVSVQYQLRETGRYNLAFFWEGGAASDASAAIDDVIVRRNSNDCLTPEDMELTNLGSNSVDLSFLSHNPLTWTVVVSKNSLTPAQLESAALGSNGIEVIETITRTTDFPLPYTVKGLTQDTDYYLYLRTDCGGNWTSVTFHTICVPYPTASLPFKEDFESIDVATTNNFANSFPTCWMRNLTTSNLDSYYYAPLVLQSTTGDNRTKALRMSLGPYAGPNYTGGNVFIVLPAMEEEMAKLQVTFKLVNPSTLKHHLDVGVISDPNDESTFKVIETIIPKITGKWVTYSVPFDEYTGTGKHIAFKAYYLDNFVGNLWIDDIEVDILKGCQGPRNLTVSNITSDKAEISWRTINEPLDYRVKVCSEPQTRWEDQGDIYDDIVYGGTSTVVSEGMLPATRYYVYVRTVCGDTSDEKYSTKIEETDFHTVCSTGLSLPYYEDFDAYDLGTMPPCWEVLSGPVIEVGPYNRGSGTQAFASPVPGKDTVYYKQIGKASLRIAGGTIQDGLIAMPLFDIDDISDVVLTFKMLRNSSSDQLVVGVMDNLESSDFYTIATLATTPYEWIPDTISFKEYKGKGNGKYICFFLKGISSGNVGLWIDELSVTNGAMTCPQPEEITLVGIEKESATVLWYGETNDYELKVSERRKIDPNVSDGLKYEKGLTESNYELNNLSPSTTYYAYIRNKCSDNEYGLWSEPVKFTTPCSNAFEIPYEENFDTYGDIIEFGYFPECWRYEVNITNQLSPDEQLNPYIENAVHNNNDNYTHNLLMEAYYDPRVKAYAKVTAISPKLEVESLKEYTMTFYARAIAANTTFYVGGVKDPSDATTFESYDTLTVGSSWTQFTINFLHYPEPQAGTKTNLHIGFQINSNDKKATTRVNITGIKVDETPEGCKPPYKLWVDSRQTRAFISWLPGDTEHSEWKYYYANTTLAPSYLETDEKFDAEIANYPDMYYFAGRGTVTEPMAVINDIIPDRVTTLYVYVKSTCSDLSVTNALFKTQGSPSYYYKTYNKTYCSDIDSIAKDTRILFTEDFKKYRSGYDTDENGNPDDSNGNGPAYSAFPDCWEREDGNSDGIAYPFIESHGELYFYSEPGQKTVAEIKPLSSKFDLSKLRIRFYAKSENEGEFKVGVRRGTDEYELYETIQLTSAYQPYIVDFENFNIAENRKHTIVFISESDEANSVRIREVILEETPYCTAPVVNIVSKTDTSFEISIEEGEDGQNLFYIAYGPVNSDPEELNEQTQTDSRYSSPVELTPNSQYDIFVAARCQNGLKSPWTKVSLTTLQAVADYPYETTFAQEDASNWALINGNSHNQWIIGTAAGRTNSLYVSNDEGETNTYTVTEPASIFAYRTIDIPAGPHKLTFDWKAGGEAGKDYMRVFLVPQSETIEGGSNGAISTVPESWIQVTGELSGQTDWETEQFGAYISHKVSEPYNLAFYWTNDNESGDEMAAAVANIDFQRDDQLCTTPEVLSATQITTNTALLHWITYNASTWYIKVFTSPTTDPANGGILYQAEKEPPYFLEGLRPDQEYYFYVKAQCGDTETPWSEFGHFKTICAALEDELLENFDVMKPACWNLYEGLASKVYDNPSELLVTTNGWTTPAMATGKDENGQDQEYAVQVFGNPSARLSLTGDNAAFWLVSPPVKLPSTASALSFDLALTARNTSSPVLADGQTDKQFMVMISTDEGITWSEADATIWNNNTESWRRYIFNDIANQGERIDIDLHKYGGKTIRVAFYGESKKADYSCDIHIDSVRIDCRQREVLTPDEICENYPYDKNGFNILPQHTGDPGTTFTHTRHEPSTTGGCDYTYVLELSVTGTIYVPREREVCEGDDYIDDDFEIKNITLTTPTTHYSTRYEAESNGCDSVIVLELTIHPIYSGGEEYLDIPVLPFEYKGVYFDVNTQNGTVPVSYKSIYGCDSIINLIVNVDNAVITSLDMNLYESLSFVPNPASGGERVNINYDFTEADLEEMVIEMYNSSGVKISSEGPSTSPVSIIAPSTSGIYLIQVKTGTDKLLFGKIIIN